MTKPHMFVSPRSWGAWHNQRMSKELKSILTAAAFALSAFGAEVTPLADNSVKLSALSPQSQTQGWGSLQTDKAVAGTPLSIGGRAFAQGLGTHANSEILYELEGQYEGFSAWVGVDDYLKNHAEAPKASVVFQVIGDDKVLFDSGVMRIGNPAKQLSVPLVGVAELKLVVTDAGDGITCDHADWAEAVLLGKKAEDRGQRSEVGGQKTEAKYTVKAPGITVRLDATGNLVNCLVGDKKLDWSLAGETKLTGCLPVGEVAVKKTGGGYAFTRKLADTRGHTCIVIDRFTPDKDNIRWDIEIVSPDAYWTTPVVSRLTCAKPEEKLIWTAWGSPDYSGTQLTPELTALVQAGKASVSGDWSDPLVPVGFLNRSWHYGNTTQACPVGADYVALPLFTLLTPSSDTGLSLVLSPDDTLLNLGLKVSAAGLVQYTRSSHRLGDNKRVSFTMHLVPHEASWRGGLRFMSGRYPQFFEAPNPRTHQLAGCGAYSICEAPIDAAKFKKMAFGFNWKLSDDFAYMGMFLPPVKAADQKWLRSGMEPCPPGQGPETSCRQMNDYAKYMKRNGFSVLSYFNVTEYGKNVNPQLGELAPGRAEDPELWKDGSAYMKAKLPKAWLKIAASDRTEWQPTALPDGRKGLMSNCYGAAIVDPGDPDYLAFLVEQGRRNNIWLPDTDGICIDRTDWLRFYNCTADDGVSWGESRSAGWPARSLYRSWANLMSQLGPVMHKADKVIYCNFMIMRLELGRELDGIYTEFGNNGNALNASALLGTRKPVVAWTYNETLRQPNPDAFMQRHLYLGAFPTAPYPNNNHCINPEPEADRLYLDYGPLLQAMRGKKWVLTPHCVETSTPGVKANLFQVPGGYALPVTFGGSAETATVHVRNLKGLAKAKCQALLPGADSAVPIPTTFKDGVLELQIPLKRGCAMVRITL